MNMANPRQPFYPQHSPYYPPYVSQTHDLSYYPNQPLMPSQTPMYPSFMQTNFVVPQMPQQPFVARTYNPGYVSSANYVNYASQPRLQSSNQPPAPSSRTAKPVTIQDAETKKVIQLPRSYASNSSSNTNGATGKSPPVQILSQPRERTESQSIVISDSKSAEVPHKSAVNISTQNSQNESAETDIAIRDQPKISTETTGFVIQPQDSQESIGSMCDDGTPLVNFVCPSGTDIEITPVPNENSDENNLNTNLSESVNEESLPSSSSIKQTSPAKNVDEITHERKSEKKKKDKQKFKDFNKKSSGDILDAYQDKVEAVVEPVSVVEPAKNIASTNKKSQDHSDQTWDEIDVDKLKIETPPNKSEPVETDRRVYDREFLLGLHSTSQKPPLSDEFSEIKIEKANSWDITNLKLLGSPGKSSINDDMFLPNFVDRHSRGKAASGGRPRQLNRNGPKKARFDSVASTEKLTESENAWKSKRRMNTSDLSEDQKVTSELLRNMRLILNKLTPQNFQILARETSELPIDTDERLKGCIDIIFEKAILEPNFAVAYANLCKTLLQLHTKRNEAQKIKKEENVVTNEFRRILLNKCQQAFEQSKEWDKLFPEEREAIEQCLDEQARTELEESLENKLAKERKKSLGNIRFIGELFKLNFLTEKIMHDCIVALLKTYDDDSLECLSKLLTTVGQSLDYEQDKKRMDQYFTKIERLVSQKKTSSRIRFMLQDVLELRENNWQPRRNENTPKTISQIQQEAEHEDAEIHRKAQELRHYEKKVPINRITHNISSNSMGAHSQEWQEVAISKTPRANPDFKQLRSMDLRLDGGSKSGWIKGSNPGSSNPTFTSERNNKFGILHDRDDHLAFEGKSGSYGSGSRRGSRFDEKEELLRNVRSFTSSATKSSSLDRRLTSNNSAMEPAPKMSKERMMLILQNILDEYTDDAMKLIETIEEIQTKILKIEDSSQFVSLSFEYVLDKHQSYVEKIGTLNHELLLSKTIEVSSFLSGLKTNLESAYDASFDIPRIWDFYGLLLAPSLKDQLSLSNLYSVSGDLRENEVAHVWIGSILQVAKKLFTSDQIYQLWLLSKLNWQMFFPENTSVDEIEDFVTEFGLEFTLNLKSSPEKLSLQSAEIHLKDMLSSGSSNTEIIEWIETKLEHHLFTKEFIRLITKVVCNLFYSKSVKSEAESYMEDRISILKKYIDNNESYMLQALFALQLLDTELQHPPQKLAHLFFQIHDKDLILEKVFLDWENSKEEECGKGVAVKSIKQFLVWLKEPDNNSESE